MEPAARPPRDRSGRVPVADNTAPPRAQTQAQTGRSVHCAPKGGTGNSATSSALGETDEELLHALTTSSAPARLRSALKDIPPSAYLTWNTPQDLLADVFGSSNITLIEPIPLPLALVSGPVTLVSVNPGYNGSHSVGRIWQPLPASPRPLRGDTPGAIVQHGELLYAMDLQWPLDASGAATWAAGDGFDRLRITLEALERNVFGGPAVEPAELALVITTVDNRTSGKPDDSLLLATMAWCFRHATSEHQTQARAALELMPGISGDLGRVRMSQVDRYRDHLGDPLAMTRTRAHLLDTWLETRAETRATVPPSQAVDLNTDTGLIHFVLSNPHSRWAEALREGLWTFMP